MKDGAEHRIKRNIPPFSRFEEDYWQRMYGELNTMDGVVNAAAYGKYMKSLCELMEISVVNLADFGFGLGYLLREVVRYLKPSRLFLLDPSQYACDQLRKKKWLNSYLYHLENTPLQKMKIPAQKFELGLCNSILQYIPDKEMDRVVKKMATSCQYLFFAVPTLEDYDAMRAENGFEDPWAFQRDRHYYQDVLAPHFTQVSWRFLESRHLVSRDHSLFDDSLFRNWEENP